MSNGAIGVFDSGIGGLTVLKELLGLLPGESFIYFGDTARVPYGNKSAETVIKFSKENVSFLMDRGVKFVVVACNTASAEALAELQETVPVPVVGVIEPGVRAAVQLSETSKIGVIGTAGTIRSQAYQKGIRGLDPKAHVFAKPCPLFVPLAEEGWIDTEITRMIASEYLDEYRTLGIDALVLGCTHYPLLHGIIGETVGKTVVLVDSAVETAREVQRILGEKNMMNAGGASGLEIYLSDIAPSFKEIGERFLGRTFPEIQLVPV
jgi:glutamate racemase